MQMIDLEAVLHAYAGTLLAITAGHGEAMQGATISCMHGHEPGCKPDSLTCLIRLHTARIGGEVPEDGNIDGVVLG